MSVKKGVWLNPNVRVSYNPEADAVVNPKNGVWPSPRERVLGIWANRWARWSGFLQRLSEQYVVDSRLRAWKKEVKREGHAEPHEPGPYCLINEMQILIENGWAHV